MATTSISSRNVGPKTMRLFTIILLAAMASACAMPENPAERIEAVREIKIRAPDTTPFDSEAALRKIYLEEYVVSYRAAMALVAVDCHMAVKGPSEKPMRAGWTDGRTDAARNPSKAAAAALGIPFDEYKELLTSTFPQK